ncbi:hypothetical protein HDA32_000829 [Spinactinospora alkalitolerans]|uniref:SRPBCC family protein n=1 Tax=Spinactinospora alkalitolerans TaxID=687207 RepID=A0A852TP00_9ACTN|nr:SRPBCC family protein [Spinactinospora alkalitolerans]NYE45709.1 hypothetical protein [Spinactinospora alkalitolerans]
MSGAAREVRVTVAHACAAPADRLWETLVDWDLHEQWMVLTRAHGGRGEGATVEAFTGVGRLGFPDTMEITNWRPATRESAGVCEVVHRGSVVRGRGRFDVVPLLGGRSRITWTEWVEPPLGALGRLGWPVAKAPLALLLRRSLRNLGELAQRR